MRPSAITLRTTAAGLLSLYVLIIASLALRPLSAERGPFTLLHRLGKHGSGGNLDWSWIQSLANVGLFIPAGFLLTVLIGRAWASVVLCVLASAAIELLQQRYLPSRVPSLADVLLNSAGGVLGSAAGWLACKRARTARIPL